MSTTTAACVTPCAVACAVPCGSFIGVQCSDAISVAIQAIMNLAQTTGSLASAIITASQALCPDLTSAQILDALSKGSKRGIFLPIYASLDDLPTYMVRTNMAALNYKNLKYSRPPCMNITDTFWVPARNTWLR